ncbi:XRE family transcriptional regulator [Kribbella turkmenica]|uniref:XRE family transcriptional regulator n=1 Tax=Kribbella turkmenica TaxID=2530375 RepID=A0A4R4W3S3_9ACTN|nr:helix-turn-helix transcriptional regulator [Kribbella turkmenica]TDD13198.1 XRE family transcriptional regulator [Kribbella turkmenica]
MLTQPRRSELSAGLRLWRQRRRVSQLELAVRAGTTQRHVSFIESGRSLPGRDMVIRLAESLQLSLRDRNALLLAGGFAPAYDEAPYDDPGLGAIRAALRSIVEGHRPYPAVVVNRRGELVLTNRSFDALTADVAPYLREVPINGPRLLLHPDGLAPRILNFDEWSWHVIDALTREAALNPDPGADALIEELTALVPPRPPTGPDHLGFAVPLRLRSEYGELRLITTLTRFGTAIDVTVSELRMEAFLPADEPTAKALRSLDPGGSG